MGFGDGHPLEVWENTVAAQLALRSPLKVFLLGLSVRDEHAPHQPSKRPNRPVPDAGVHEVLDTVKLQEDHERNGCSRCTD